MALWAYDASRFPDSGPTSRLLSRSSEAVSPQPVVLPDSPTIGRVPSLIDVPVIPQMWFSTELQVTTPVPEWDNQPVRMAMEEEAEVTADGTVQWVLRRQTELHLVR